MSLPKCFALLRLALLSVFLALVGTPQIAAAKETPLKPFTTYPTELRFVSFDKHSAHLTVRPLSSATTPKYPFYYPAREAAQSWPVFIYATSNRPVYDMKREFRFEAMYDGIIDSLDYLPPKVVSEKIRRAMKEGAAGDTRYPLSEKVKTFNLVRLPRDAAEMSIVEHLHWMDDYLEDRTKSNSYFSSINSCMILTYKLEPNAQKRYTNYFDIRITFEREIRPDGTMDTYMLARADYTYTCSFGEFQGH